MRRLFTEFERRIALAMPYPPALPKKQRTIHTGKYLWDQNLWVRLFAYLTLPYPTLPPNASPPTRLPHASQRLSSHTPLNTSPPARLPRQNKVVLSEMAGRQVHPLRRGRTQFIHPCLLPLTRPPILTRALTLTGLPSGWIGCGLDQQPPQPPARTPLLERGSAAHTAAADCTAAVGCDHRAIPLVHAAEYYLRRIHLLLLWPSWQQQRRRLQLLRDWQVRGGGCGGDCATRRGKASPRTRVAGLDGEWLWAKGQALDVRRSYFPRGQHPLHVHRADGGGKDMAAGALRAV